MKNLKFMLIIIILLSMAAAAALAQYYQKDDYGEISTTRKNQLGGYDYYDKNGNMTSYSSKNYQGEYIYYDKEGNKIGVLKQDKQKSGYTFYNADNIPTKTLQKMPTGEYRYKDKSEGGLKGITPPPGEDIGFVPPSSFTGGTLDTDLEGTFKK